MQYVTATHTEGTSLCLFAEPIVFTRGVPPPEAFPTEQLAECFADALAADPAVVLQYGQQPGYPRLRQQIAAEFQISDREVLVANGSLQLQDLIAAELVKPGATVLTEQPSYDRAITAFKRRGAQVIGIPLEQDGIDIARLEAAIKRQVPAFLYVIPDFQNPAGVTTSLAKRRSRIVELAEQYRFWVLEDVPYRKLRYRGSDLPMLRDISPTRVLTLTSFSKLLSPGLRVGYMVGAPALVDAVTKQAEHTYLSPVLPTQAAVAEYIKRNWLQAQYRSAQSPLPAALAGHADRQCAPILPALSSSEPDGGFFVSVTLPASANTSNLIERAKQIGLILTPGQPFFANPNQGPAPIGERFVRLPFCAVTPNRSMRVCGAWRAWCRARNNRRLFSRKDLRMDIQIYGSGAMSDLFGDMVVYRSLRPANRGCQGCPTFVLARRRARANSPMRRSWRKFCERRANVALLVRRSSA